MQFIKRKNMQEGEELLYMPQLHWFYTVKHMVLSLPFFLVLLILWLNAEYLPVDAAAFSFTAIIRHAFIAAALVVLLDFLWRILLYLSTEYGITNKRLLSKRGVLRLVTGEIPIDRIESIDIVQGILGRIFHYGRLRIGGIGGRRLVFFMVSRPYATRRKIAEIIEKNKAITVVHGEFPAAQPAAGQEPPAEEEPFYRYGTFIRVIPDSAQ
jgi:uncharacterized membrane protein YdbT with pleckstrin-like domain